MMAVLSVASMVSYVSPLRRPLMHASVSMRRTLSCRASLSTATMLDQVPQRLKLEEATTEHWSRVVDALGPFTKGNRIERLNEVLAHRRDGLHVVLENVADPYNVAAILRTAEGLCIQYVHSIEAIGSTELTPRTSRRAVSNVAMGASRWLTFMRYKSAEECYAALRELELQVVTSDCPPADPEDFDAPSGSRREAQARAARS